MEYPDNQPTTDITPPPLPDEITTIEQARAVIDQLKNRPPVTQEIVIVNDSTAAKPALQVAFDPADNLRRRKWSYTYAELAVLFNMKRDAVRQAVKRQIFNPSSLESICHYHAHRQRKDGSFFTTRILEEIEKLLNSDIAEIHLYRHNDDKLILTASTPSKHSWKINFAASEKQA